MSKYFYYAVGDIHGRLDLLNRLIPRIEMHAASHNATPIPVFLGDYVDRGPDSKGVIDRIIELQTTHSAIALKGNHEDLMQNADPKFAPHRLRGLEKPTLSEWREMEERMYWWTMNGGYQTMASYGVEIGAAKANPFEAYKSVDQSHLDWIRSLPTFHETENHYFVHAGVNPYKSLADQNDNSRMWIRGEWLNSNVDMGKHVVHGHTPVDDADVHPNRTNLDTGAVYGGALSCGVFDPTKHKPIDLIVVKA